jgi:hypothetical protein
MALEACIVVEGEPLDAGPGPTGPVRLKEGSENPEPSKDRTQQAPNIPRRVMKKKLSIDQNSAKRRRKMKASLRYQGLTGEGLDDSSMGLNYKRKLPEKMVCLVII